MNGKQITLTILAVVVTWSMLGALALSLQQESVKGVVGKLWSVTDTASAAIDGVDNYVANYTGDRQMLVQMVTDARAALSQAQLNHSDEQLMEVMGQLGQIQVLVESAQAFTDLSEVQLAQMDNLVGQLSRINQARQNVIDAQVSYNQTRVVSGPVGWLLYPRMRVAGQDFNTEQAAPRSNYQNP